MCTYMLCIWWVCICGSNVSGGEHVGLNTKAGFACGSSPLPVLLACLVLSLLAPACLSALTPTNCTDKTNSSATKESRPQAASSFTVASRHKVDLEKMTLNVQRRANLQGSPNKHSAWHLRHQDNRDPVVVSLCTCHSEQISPGTHPPSSPPNQSGKRLGTTQCSVAHYFRPLCLPSLWHNGELFLCFDLPGPGLG